jgi:hypothetical protein
VYCQGENRSGIRRWKDLDTQFGKNETRGAERDRDFVHKLRVVLKEPNETEVWLQVLVRANIVSNDAIAPMREACASLARIITASIRTMKQRGVSASG